jgi:tRNA nucleotidyltransferase/poly(A) polymerase
MRTFKQYLKEEVSPPVSNWGELQAENNELATGVRLLRKIEKLGGEALIVGGSVRDILLGKPIKDVDIATNVPLEKIKQNFKTNDIGQSGDFGITMVHYGGHEFEVANYREEEGTSDNRRPDRVSMVNNFKSDSARRDITINSMGMNSKGEIIDYQGGIDDLKNGIIKAVGNARSRFEEDALRILRVDRFASKYGFKIEDDTKRAMKELEHLIDNVSRERVREELLKMSSSGTQLANYIKGLDDSGLLGRVLPEIKALQGMEQNPEHHPEGDAYVHTLAAVAASRSTDPITNISILFHDLGKGRGSTGDKNGYPTYHGHEKLSGEMATDLSKRLKFSKKETQAIAFAADMHMNGHRLNQMTKKKIVKIVNDPNWEVLKATTFADEMSRGNVTQDAIDAFDDRMKRAEDMAAEVSAGGGDAGIKNRLKEKIDGNKIMKWTGLRRGREMGMILKATQEWLYDNLEASEDEVYEYVMSQYNELGYKGQDSLEERYMRIYNE